MRALIVGMGQIGQAVSKIIPAAQTLDLQKKSIERPIEVMHICIPYTKDFNKQVRDYIDIFSPQHVVVWSTVPIGTCSEISPKVIHTPVEGKHPELEMSIRQMERWTGYNDDDEGMWAANYFRSLGMRVKPVEDTRWTEALKLLSTTEFGVNIVFAAYKAKVADMIGMDYKLAKEWNMEYNKLYRGLGMERRFQKFVLDPPKGRIGGHCVVPNAKILMELVPDSMVKRIIKQGEEL